ncbi:MarR family winged helix-turn-helix transcriptional regulator [Promicromonospora thailandica]|uniref:MarR family winged helix-turn-helix transcriptional regulator n=1 Tax=Promicromonospora thailandica TaxID=765201 RepID=UPI0020A56A88|nr:MarR family winged helix-turn-helix transcriptional regulator [Promicromonospora thailandica]BFF16599.1 hypothetical protein GCM10025730_01200 [Promicromonospora thailandica]
MSAAEEYRLLIADVYELAGTSRRTSEALAADAGQTVARWHTLSVFSADPMTVADGARRLGLARQSVQRVVRDLLAEGLLTSSPNPDHRTAPLIGTTARGAAVLAELVERSDADRRARLAAGGLTGAELRAARLTLRAVLDTLR